MQKNTMRKLAQRLNPIMTACQECGATGKLQRHHPDYSKPDQVEILCIPCHVKADQRDGHRHVKQMRACKVCGTMFLPSHSKKSSTCSSACLSTVGRMNAMKRWGSGTENQTSRE